ncbi:MAG: hypothetical protein D6675_02075 [Gemmatimonadetes bacterium]|nr:MAG: hypothetical protein D6675_02075 [Gemmatimonadota bacterium]
MRNVLILLIISLWICPTALWAESGLNLENNLLNPVETPEYLALLQGDDDGNSANMSANTGEKSVGKALLMSALVPGSGHLYAGEKYGLIFTAVEIAAWTTYFVFNSNGDDKTDEYKAFANEHYSVDQYIEVRNDLMNVALADPVFLEDETDPRYGRTNIYVSAVWDPDEEIYRFVPSRTHFVLLANEFSWDGVGSPPEEFYFDTSTYENGVFTPGVNEYPRYDHEFYEDIGKYDKYILGWDDWYQTADQGNPYTAFIWEREHPYGWSPHDAGFPEAVLGDDASPNRATYNRMRDDAEAEYDKANLGMGVVLVNHVAATIDAIRLTKKYNKNLAEMQRSQPKPLDWQFSVDWRGGEPEAKLALIKSY